MGNKKITLIASIVLGLASLLHLVRVLAGWSLIVENFMIPAWFSVLAFLIAGVLSYKLFWVYRMGK